MNKEQFLKATKDPEVIVRQATITPEMARELLLQNSINRKINDAVVALYASDMKSNGWNCYSSVLQFDENMNVIDGQHRLTACKSAGGSFETLVIIRDDATVQQAQSTIDRGFKRNLAGDLTIAGVKNSNVVAAITRTAYARNVVGMTTEQLFGTVAKHAAVMDKVYYAYYFEHRKEIDALAALVSRIKSMNESGLKMPSSVYRTLAIVFSEYSIGEAEEFFKRLVSVDDPDDIAPNCGIKLLRQKLIKQLGSSLYKIDKYSLAALTVKAWNMYNTGGQATILRFKAGGASPDHFPLVYGVDYNNE